MLHKRMQQGLSEDEAGFVGAVAMKALQSARGKGITTEASGNVLFSMYGVTAVCKPEADGFYTLTGYVISDFTKINKGDTAAAEVAAQFYALPAFDRWQKVGALLRRGLARFDAIVKQNPENWQEIVSHEIEMLKIKIDARGFNTFMKAPNGEPTKLTERQWLQVRTRAFKAWFGDWENDPEHASKVLDENGEPLVVWHGTPERFNVFDRTKTRANMDIQGNFFTPWELDAQGYGENVRAFFLNIRKPAGFQQGYLISDLKS